MSYDIFIHSEYAYIILIGKCPLEGSRMWCETETG